MAKKDCIVMSVSVGVMISILTLWGVGSQINNWSGTSNGSHYWKWTELYMLPI